MSFADSHPAPCIEFRAELALAIRLFKHAFERPEFAK
jgi:hypothetical protein